MKIILLGVDEGGSTMEMVMVVVLVIVVVAVAAAAERRETCFW